MLAYASSHTVQSKDRADLRGKREAPGCRMIIERLDAEMVARAKQRPALGIPDREGEVALQKGRTCLAPFEIGAHQKRRVGDRPVAYAEPSQKLVAVVQPAIG